MNCRRSHVALTLMTGCSKAITMTFLKNSVMLCWPLAHKRLTVVKLSAD